MGSLVGVDTYTKQKIVKHSNTEVTLPPFYARGSETGASPSQPTETSRCMRQSGLKAASRAEGEKPRTAQNTVSA